MKASARTSKSTVDGGHRNLDRIMVIMGALAQAAAAGLRLTDIVKLTRLGKSTTHRLLAGMAAHGLVEQDVETGRFFVGLKMLSWATAAKTRFRFVRLAEATLDRICQSTEDTVYLVARVGDESVCIDSREGAFPVRVLTLNVGDRRPLGIGSGSLAMLAALPDEEVDRILKVQAKARSVFPFTDSQLRQMIKETRRQGFAYTNAHLFPGMERVMDMAAIAVPIRRGDGTPVAALHLTAIPSRLRQPRCGNLVATLQRDASRLEKEFRPVLDAFRETQRIR